MKITKIKVTEKNITVEWFEETAPDITLKLVCEIPALPVFYAAAEKYACILAKMADIQKEVTFYSLAFTFNSDDFNAAPKCQGTFAYCADSENSCEVKIGPFTAFGVIDKTPANKVEQALRNLYLAAQDYAKGKNAQISLNFEDEQK
jgi:hypothetical protein